MHQKCCIGTATTNFTARYFDNKSDGYTKFRANSLCYLHRLRFVDRALQSHFLSLMYINVKII